MHLSASSVFSHTYVEVASGTQVTCEVVAEQLEVFVGERSELLGLSNGVTILLGEEAVKRLLDNLTEGLAALNADEAA
ncbi:hypothetical protein ALI22I_27230 [Saccharothrix sp. ALI-22-I]|uniref:hypothetical protein n=1 Tax=Saccharothrix sp. ALI-22-I TaxID=1933778 RepID=UPI00097C3848|nr:hypothetical protein [Saccharothrix sp. ALI-22-I]ONI85495.1 hypothetical protein ALI22I_27230 [Saccharothrix sp. ALI-22-I]